MKSAGGCSPTEIGSSTTCQVCVAASAEKNSIVKAFRRALSENSHSHRTSDAPSVRTLDNAKFDQCPANTEKQLARMSCACILDAIFYQRVDKLSAFSCSSAQRE